MSHFSSPVVVCRPALPSDAAAVLDFTRFIWEGHDYIRYVWKDWLADPEGLLVVAEYGGRAVGLGKITRLAPGQWWLEGLRVDPKFQGQKIGSHIHEYLDAWWSEQAGGAVRLMTSWERVQVHHLCERMGYKKLGEVRSYSAPATFAAEDPFQPVAGGDLAAAAETAARWLPQYNGLMDSGWRFSQPDEAALAEKARDGRAYWWRNISEGLLVCREEEDDGERVLGIGFAAVPRNRLAMMLRDARSLAHRLGCRRLVWLAPALPWVEAALRETGFSTDWDGTAYLFGKGR